MALIKCPECGNDVSDSAVVCPRCGYPINNHTTTQYPNTEQNSFGNNCPNYNSNSPNYNNYNNYGNVNTPYDNNYNKVSDGGVNICGIIGFVLSIVSLFLALWGIVATTGLIFSIVGVIIGSNNPKRKIGIAVSGIIINILSLIYTVFVIISTM